MIKLNGYKFETHEIVTEDGYKSLAFRIPPKIHDNRKEKQPIVLDHGIQYNIHTTAAFVLVNAGYDVWLVNQRDSGYTTHVKYKMSDFKFWANSLDTVATKGISAILNTVATATNKSGSIIYIGHSRGATLAFMYASEYPEEAQKILTGVVALALIIYFEPVFYVKLLFQLSPVLSLNVPLSLMQVQQYARMFHSGKFQKYDYVKKGSILKYYQEQLPLYNLTNCKLPVYMFYGTCDIFIKEKAVKKVFKELGCSEKEYFRIPSGTNTKKLKFGHNDYLFAKDIEELFYRNLLRVLDKLQPKK
ncbi:gastric triacylglycerol lipase-like [Zophobas morio]|uniref:gastric triacylglycerol lipase-like n=1 Tax=Zophobas morio TaxID=2755281 RepID=UPI003083596C